MTTLLKNGTVIDVIHETYVKTNVLFDNEKIIDLGEIEEADEIIDVTGKYLCPCFIDGHVHVESSMMSPRNMARVMMIHGTCAIISDPHEIANVCGIKGIEYMLEDSKDLPMKIYYTLPSCVPSAPVDENGATLSAKDLEPLYKNEKIIALGEVMNYPGVIMGDKDLLKKISDAKKHGRIINGHAPLLSGENLKKYVEAGIGDDHECTNIYEAKEKHKLGQWIFIREGSAAHNLKALLDLFDDKYYKRCAFVNDDVHYGDLLEAGHMDKIIKKAIRYGKDPLRAIQMATINPATYYKLDDLGSISKGKLANIVVLNDIENMDIKDVYLNGKLVCKDKKLVEFENKPVRKELDEIVHNTFNLKPLTKEQFFIEPKGSKVRCIEIIPGEIITNEVIEELDFSKNNGVSYERNILKIAVIERHKNTGHIGLGYIKGLDLKGVSLASSVSHDNHNLVVVGYNDEDMTLAANEVIKNKGGQSAAYEGKILVSLPLPIGGLMSDLKAEELFKFDLELKKLGSVYKFGEDTDPYMTLSFMALPVIPKLKLTTKGLFDVNKFELVDLFVE